MNKLATLLLSLCFYCVNSQGQLVVSGYTNYELSGFNVLVQTTALAPSRLPHTNAALDRLEDNLMEISGLCVSDDIMDSLKAVSIFMDWNITEGITQYFMDQQWLIDHNYNMKKWKNIEISNIKNFVSATNLNQPYRIMNEMAHAYLHRVLNMESPALTEAYQSALSSGLYTNVQYYAGNDTYTTQSSALAITSQENFFAELSETYFGTNNYFPFNREEFSAYDAAGYEVIKSIWVSNVNSTVSVDGLTLTSNEEDIDAVYQWIDCNNDNAPINHAFGKSLTVTDNGSYAVIVTKAGCSETSECIEISTIGVEDPYASSAIKAFPNPGEGYYTVTVAKQMSSMFVKITDITGQIIMSDNVKGNIFKIDISNHPDGIYLLEVGNGVMSYKTKLIKN